MASEIPKEQWLQAIETAGGITQEIARILGVHRTTVYRTAKADPEIAEAIAEQQKICIDYALRNVRDGLMEGDLKLTMWYLDRKGRDLGFGKEIKVDATVEQQAKIVMYFPDDGREQQTEPEDGEVG